ncbi:str-97 [Pristionchus pacificus]|uniref:Str-97 n=1 Tax=Pristionchus pacificus TaxID=54126 RepID=A0A2A6C3V8_PRIPA|nr:str-97 [Pristionchus pacificus]|eukprot:PDM72806.1 str-97 [Pristionchus pacificus]
MFLLQIVILPSSVLYLFATAFSEEDQRFLGLDEGQVLHFPSAFNASLVTPTEWQLVTTTLTFGAHESECFREGVKRMILGEFCRSGERKRRRISWIGLKTALGIGVSRASGRATDIPLLWAVKKGGMNTWKLLKNGWSNKWNVISWTANTALDAYSWYSLRQSINQLQENMSKGLNSSSNSLSALDESILCDRQIQLERTKWTLMTSGGYMIPELSSVRFDKKIVDTTKAKVLSCSEENGELAVTMAEAKMLRQASDSQQMYDEIMTAVTMEDGSMLVSSRKNYIVELNGTKTYVKECVPDDSGLTVLCERLHDSESIPQYKVPVNSRERILWMLELRDAMIVVTNAKKLLYREVDGTDYGETIMKPNLLIRCKAGEVFSFGQDKVKCTTRQRRNLAVRSQEVMATGAKPYIANLSSLVKAVEGRIEERKESFFGNLLGNTFILVSRIEMKINNELRFNRSLGSYKQLLTVFAAYDMYLSALHGVVKPKVFIVGTTFGCVTDFEDRVGDWGKTFEKNSTQKVISLTCSCFTIPFALIIVHFLYRYWAIRSPHLIYLFSKKNCIAAIAFYLAGAFIMWYLLALYGTTGEGKEPGKYILIAESFRRFGRTIKEGWLIMNHWENGEFNSRVIGTLISVDLVMIISFSIATTLGSLTFHHIKRAEKISVKTQNLQWKLLVAVCAQTFVPLVLVYIPYACVLNFPFFGIPPFLSIDELIIVFLACFPAWDAVIMIAMMKDYRMGLIGIVRKKKNSVQPKELWKKVASMVVPRTSLSLT